MAVSTELTETSRKSLFVMRAIAARYVYASGTPAETGILNRSTISFMGVGTASMSRGGEQTTSVILVHGMLISMPSVQEQIRRKGIIESRVSTPPSAGAEATAMAKQRVTKHPL